jgi:hypothetical protein
MTDRITKDIIKSSEVLDLLEKINDIHIKNELRVRQKCQYDMHMRHIDMHVRGRVMFGYNHKSIIINVLRKCYIFWHGDCMIIK